MSPPTLIIIISFLFSMDRGRAILTTSCDEDSMTKSTLDIRSERLSRLGFSGSSYEKEPTKICRKNLVRNKTTKNKSLEWSRFTKLLKRLLKDDMRLSVKQKDIEPNI
jgi:hypothetical protein